MLTDRAPGATLELDEALDFQRHQLRVQTAAWSVLTLLLALALAGFCGGGPLSRGQALAPGVRLDYPRLLRQQTPQTVKVFVDAGMRQGGGLRLAVDRHWLAGVELERITPRPEREELDSERVVYHFAALPGERPAMVALEFQATVAGRHRGSIAGAVFEQLVYP